MKPGQSLWSKKLSIAAGLASVAFFAPSALAQFNDQWLTLVLDNSRLKASNGVTASTVLTNGFEKDFGAADVDKDGWTDLAVCQKVQVSFPGPQPGVFFRNMKGTLVDVTTTLTSSLSAGDPGFSRSLDTRDVEFADLNGDGWLDMVTSQSDLTSNTAAASKVFTHPRVYMNLGNNGSGVWLGLRHEDTRIPQLKTIPGNVNGSIRFCDLDIADVDADGDKDLYFVDYDTDENGHGEAANIDLNDRLLLNDGTGNFTDGTAASFGTTAMWSSAFGTEIQFHDFNGDTRIDFAKISTLTESPNRIEVVYNNANNTTLPNFTGGFDVLQTADSGENYTMANADINNDGRIDMIIGDDATDHYQFNTGNDGIGQVIWSSDLNYSYLTGSSEQASGQVSFPGQMYAKDFNLDGWQDVIVTDVDLDLPGCTRRTHIFHNRGGTPGATNIVLREEKEMSGAGGWFGAVSAPGGWSLNYPKGVNDAGLLDIDNDGDTEIVLGKCTGADVWMNGTNPVVCQPTVLAASNGDLNVAICGAPLWSNLTANLSITNGPAFGTAVTLVGLAPTTLPAFGGTVMMPVIPSLSLNLPLNGSGAITLPIPGGGATVAGATVYLQVLAGFPIEVSNIIAVTVFN